MLKRQNSQTNYKGLGEIGGFWPYIPEEYGGAGLDHYPFNSCNCDRDSGVRSTSSAILFSDVSNLEIRK
jgi:alkylation response protein AidB-like acyl-CoA dehydrogenase